MTDAICKYCGGEIKKNDRFILVGFYPGKWRRMGYHYLFDGPKYFGELYHEPCYMESVEKQEQNKRNS
jgi:hypothetical protein